MTSYTNGHQVVAVHVVGGVQFDFKGQKFTPRQPELVDCYLMLGGLCKGVHWQLSPN